MYFFSTSICIITFLQGSGVRSNRRAQCADGVIGVLSVSSPLEGRWMVGRSSPEPRVLRRDATYEAKLYNIGSHRTEAISQKDFSSRRNFHIYKKRI